MSESEDPWAGIRQLDRPTGDYAAAVEHFTRVSMGIPMEVSPREVLLRELAEKYNERTEAYDRTVCTAEHNGVAMPHNAQESSLINAHARLVLDDLVAEGAPLIGRLSLMREIQRINRNRP